jgi:DNA-binding CsgD family transcriptional regulator
LTVRTSEGWGPQSASVASRVFVRTLADRLREERHRSFVGRDREREIFLGALAGSEPALLFWSGDAGVGKSMLLREFQRICEVEGTPVAVLHAADTGEKSSPSRSSSKRRIRTALAAELGERSRRPVLLVDDFEALADPSWVLEQLFPVLPSQTLIVAASRRPPPIELSRDAGWAAITQEERILPFGEADAREFFEQRAVPMEARSTLLELSGGHPLGLSLSADVLRDGPLTEYRVYDIQRRILDALGLEPRSRAERLALGLGAVARTVTLELLEYVLAALGDASSEDPQRLFAWLCEHSLVEPRRTGLWLHPLVRRGLLSRLKRERRLEYEALHLAVREFYVEKIALGVDGARWLKDLVYTQSASPAERLLGSADDDDPAAVEPARSADRATVVELVREIEGNESARAAEGWLDTHPHTFEVVRREQVNSVLQALVLDPNTVESLPSSDPASAIVHEFLRQNPLRPDEQAVFFRFRLDRTAMQAPAQRMTPLLAREIQLILSASRPAYTFSVYREFGDWKSILDRAGVPFRRCGRFDTSKGAHSVVAYSWRERPLRELLLSAGRDGAEVRRQKPPELGSSPSGSSDDLQLKVRKRVAELGQRARLTTRELEILELLCLGKSGAEIARSLGIRPRTVKFHQENILRKTGIASRLELFKVLL